MGRGERRTLTVIDRLAFEASQFQTVRMASPEGEAPRATTLLAAVDNGRGQVGVAVLSLETGTLRLLQTLEESPSCFSNAEAAIDAAAPDLVVVCATSSAKGGGLVELLSSRYALVRSPRSQFDDTRGAVMVRQLARASDKEVVTHAKEIYLALAAASAVLRHASDALLLVAVPDTLGVTVELTTTYVQIDGGAAQALELVSGKGSLASLFRPQTVGGKRLLRATLLQPRRSLPTLLPRLDCLEALLSDEGLFMALGSLLKRRGALDHLGVFSFKEEVRFCRLACSPIIASHLSPRSARRARTLPSPPPASPRCSTCAARWRCCPSCPWRWRGRARSCCAPSGTA